MLRQQRPNPDKSVLMARQSHSLRLDSFAMSTVSLNFAHTRRWTACHLASPVDSIGSTLLLPKCIKQRAQYILMSAPSGTESDIGARRTVGSLHSLVGVTNVTALAVRLQ